MIHVEVYEQLKKLLQKETEAELSLDKFVVQNDALQRLLDEENPDEPFLTYAYMSATSDKMLPFRMVMTSMGFIFFAEDLYIGCDYVHMKSAKEIAEAIVLTCKLFLSGQVRLVITHSARRFVADELFLVSGNHQQVLAVATHFPFWIDLPFVRRDPHTLVLENRVMQHVSTQKLHNFYAENKELAASYETVGRVVDWSEAAPLDTGLWKDIVSEMTWHKTAKKPLENVWSYALKQWETWVFTFVFGAFFITLSLLVPAYGTLIRTASQISFTVFVLWFLPGYMQRKHARKAAEASKNHAE